LSINKILIGIVGYSPVLDSYPLGPNLMNNLKERDWANINVDIQNMTWSPIHITQRLQENKLEFDRVVLVGSKTISTNPGRVESYKWKSKKVDEIKIQERIFEGVTGVVSLENTLVIGDYFKIWPKEVFTVEVDLPGEVFGDIVIAENQGKSKNTDLIEILKFDPEKVIEEIELQTYLVSSCNFEQEYFPEKNPDTILEPEIFSKHRFETQNTLN
tara:strand:- start:716 stop:1360 length:645 start_codon:yes stop_codon:yes gene_type:complete